MATKHMTIDALARMTQEGLRDVEGRLVSTMKEGFETVLEEMRGLRDDVKQSRQASRVETADLADRVATLEKRMNKVEDQVQV
jgi:hypothetical protein